jgi:hypothetical protein
MRARCVVAPLLAAAAAGCGAGQSEDAGAPAAARTREAALPVSPGSSATLMRFQGVGRIEGACRDRPRLAFRVEERTAAVAVDAGRDLVRTLDPGERLLARSSRSALLRWHVASSHGDGVRVVTASVAVTPVRGGRGACLFSVQSVRSGRIP